MDLKLKSFGEVERVDIYDDGIGFVSTYNHWISNISQSTREEVVATIATHAYGNEKASNPTKLYEFLKERNHLSCFEFIHSGQKENNSYNIADSLRHNDFPVYGEDCEKYIENVKDNVALFRIKAPLFVARQFMRHRSFSYLELSRRYTKGTKKEFEFYRQDDILFRDIYKQAVYAYNSLVDNGEKPEIARGVIPMAAYTDFYAMTDIPGLKNFFRLRLDNHAQYEIRVVAEAMKEILKRNQPKMYNEIFEECI